MLSICQIGLFLKVFSDNTRCREKDHWMAGLQVKEIELNCFTTYK